jgi:hypothetical protein
LRFFKTWGSRVQPASAAARTQQMASVAEVAEIAFLTLLAPLWDYYYMRLDQERAIFPLWCDHFVIVVIFALVVIVVIFLIFVTGGLALEGRDIRCGGEQKVRVCPFVEGRWDNL